jgi:hypothetical protein
MRQSFLVSFVLSSVAITSMFAFRSLLVSGCLTIAAIAMTLLWVAHLVVFAIRASRGLGQVSATGVPFDASRRAVVPQITRIFLGAAVITALPAGFANAADCYATCVYTDDAGGRWIGVSSDGCDSACSQALNKCNSGGSTNCKRDRCSQTDC